VSGDYTQAEIVRTLKRIEEGQSSLAAKVDGLTAGFVPRSEWQIWADARDREIRDLKAAKAPWWTWAAVLISFGSLAVTVLPKLVN
jgi:hypothetical protein